MGKLYLVATPIGNLEDLSFRAARILREIPLIAAEDTRTTSKLLNHYEIETQLTPYHDHNKQKVAPKLLEHLEREDLALVSDAGTPAINDPGFYLVQAALQSGHEVIPIPGPSAPVAALSASGIAPDSFLYLGYLPRKSAARQSALSQVEKLPWTLVFLETPHRLLEALEDCQKILGDRRIAVGRELTKLHEEIYRGFISEARVHFGAKSPKGEITLVVAGRGSGVTWPEAKIKSEIKNRLELNDSSPSQLAKILAKESGWSRSRIYDLIQHLENQKE